MARQPGAQRGFVATSEGNKAHGWYGRDPIGDDRVATGTHLRSKALKSSPHVQACRPTAGGQRPRWRGAAAGGNTVGGCEVRCGKGESGAPRHL